MKCPHTADIQRTDLIHCRLCLLHAFGALYMHNEIDDVRSYRCKATGMEDSKNRINIISHRHI